MRLITSRQAFEITDSDADTLEYEADFIVGRWPPWIRVLSGALAMGLIAAGLRKRGASGTCSTLVGTALFSRAVVNRDITHILGTLILPVLRMRRSLVIAAPVETVFDFWRDFSNYPNFMSFIREVSVDDSGTLTWIARAPGGREIHWRTTVHAIQPNQKLLWKSIPGSLIATEGVVQMRAADSRTQLEIELRYAPPFGALGYAAAHILGFDPRSRFDEDLDIMKRLIENQAYLDRLRVQAR